METQVCDNTPQKYCQKSNVCHNTEGTKIWYKVDRPITRREFLKSFFRWLKCNKRE